MNTQHLTTYMRRLSAALKTPRGLLRATLLVALVAVWFALGVRVFGTPVVDAVSQYDLVIIHAAGRGALAGADPYSPEFIASLHADPHGTPYAYPLASLWLVLPFLPFPVAWAATLWASVSMAGLVACAPLMGRAAPRWIWLVPLLFYPSLYAIKITQWAPIQIALLALSLWLFRRRAPFWSGALLPLVTAKPTTGLPLLLFGLVLCGASARWWRGLVLGGLAWYGLPLLLQPDWPLRWLESLRAYADPAAGQFLLTLTDLPDGRICAALAGLVALWHVRRGHRLGLACALLVIATLATPHRAQYDYPLFCIPLLFLPRRHAWLIAVAVAASWAFPITFELGWASSLQLTLFNAAPALLACLLVERPRPPGRATIAYRELALGST
jgi:hypothetical protein